MTDALEAVAVHMVVIKLKRLVVDAGFELVCFHCRSLDSTIKAHFRYLIRRLKGPFASMLMITAECRVRVPVAIRWPGRGRRGISIVTRQVTRQCHY